MSAKVLVIIGMHRSGTSVISQWLHRCGLAIGKRLEGSGIGNVQGHFEDVDFLEMHQQLLLQRHCPVTGFLHQPVSPLSEKEQEQMRSLIKNKNAQHEEWGWKDPRTCLFLATYHQLIPEAFYIVVVRSFGATVSSLITREYNMQEERFRTKKGLSKLKWILFKRKSLGKLFEKNTDRFLKIWIHYYEQILSAVKQLPRDRFVFVSYSMLAENDEAVFMQLRREWNFSLDYIPFARIFKKELLSETTNIQKYIKDKDLEAKATAIELNIILKYLKGDKLLAQ